MSKQTNDLYSNIELVPDDYQAENTGTASEEQSSHNSRHEHQGVDSDHDNSSHHNSEHSHHSSEHRHHSSSHSHHSSSHHSSRHHSHHSSGTGKKKSSKKKKWSKKKKVFIIILAILLFIILALFVTLAVMHYLGKKSLLGEEAISLTLPDDIDYDDIEGDGKTIVYKGHTYEYNSNIASILFMGIDHDEFKDDAVPATAGQADALYLMTYNISNGKIKVLALNRDIMTDISRYDGEGNYYDTSTKQLCLAYSFGDGKHLSAKNQVVAVERLIYNIPISTYYAIDFSSLKILNDDIGGVTLTPEYTFSSFTEGQTVTLMGETAEQFVRYRDTTLLDDNLRRMNCQKLYLNSFASQLLPAIKKDMNVPLKLYQDSSKYTVTNLDANIMVYLASTLATNYSGLNIMSVKGKYVETKNDAYAEYKINKTDLFEKILNIYYTKIS